MSKITINTLGQLLDNVETEEKATKLVFYIKELQQENKHLKEKIDILLEDNNQLEEIRIKAINFIENECAWELLEEESEELLEILGDKE